MTATFDVVDSQVHVLEPHSAAHPWIPRPDGNESVAAQVWDRHAASNATVASMIRTLDDAGVAGALIVTPAIYAWDNSYSIAAHVLAPDRFRVVGRVDPSRSHLERAVQELLRQPGMVGLRLVILSAEEESALRSGGYDPLFRAMSAADAPLCITAPGALAQVERVARRYDRLALVIDNLGFPPPWRAGDDAFAHVPDLLRLRSCPNVSVKLCAAPSASRLPYPYADLWPPLHQLLSGFGAERFMWGSDTTIHPQPYADLVGWLRDSDEIGDDDKRAILGGNLRRVFRWPKGDPLL